MSLSRVAVTFAAALTIAGVPACSFIFNSGPSEVAQGRYYSSGNAEYDAFFVDVYQQQLVMARAPGELTDARAALTQALVLDASAQNAELAEKLRLALNSLGQRGARVHFEVRLPSPPDPEHSIALISASPPPEGNERTSLAAAEAALTRLLRLAATMHQSEAELAKLRTSVPALEAKVDAAFQERGPRQRERTRQNLKDAERVMVLMQARADETASPVDGLYRELNRVFASSEPPPSEGASPPKPEEKPRPRPAPRPRPDVAQPAPRSEGAPVASPKPTAPKSADFEP
ncbi:MAG TPA: hypothetical protein VFQ35_18985 [Polyangiaceae bacterium]|nr:hypothetical protein [Polyangiaceae bacterium]